jgi:hypothetical protein
MRLFKYFATLALLFVYACPAFADIALPPSERAHRSDEIRSDLPDVKMTIQRVEGLREARLQIPRSQLGRATAAAGLTGGAEGDGPGLGGAGNVVAGVFLSLAVVLTGLLLVRSRRRVALGRAAAVLVVGACVAGVCAVAAYANAGLPGWQPQNPGTLTKAALPGKPLGGWVRVEVVEEGNEIKLLLPAKSRGGDDEEE